MGRIDNLIALLASDHVGCHRPILYVENVGSVSLHVVDETQRSRQAPRFIEQETDAKIHFQEGETHFHPPF